MIFVLVYFKTIQYVFDLFSNEFDIHFSYAGDQKNETLPEKSICEKLRIETIDKF